MSAPEEIEEFEEFDRAYVRRLANMVAGRALYDMLNMAEGESFLRERFPNPALHDEVCDEVARIATRLMSRGETAPGRTS